MSFSLTRLLKASNLIRQGRLPNVTRLIQRVMGNASNASNAAAAPASGPGEAMPRAFNPSATPFASEVVIDVPFRDFPAAPSQGMRFLPHTHERELPPGTPGREPANDWHAEPGVADRQGYFDYTPVIDPVAIPEPAPLVQPPRPAAAPVKVRPDTAARQTDFDPTPVADTVPIPKPAPLVRPPRRAAAPVKVQPDTAARQTDFDPTPVADTVAIPEPASLVQPARPAAPPVKVRPESFQAHRFIFQGTDYAYRLYVPPSMPTVPSNPFANLAGTPVDHPGGTAPVSPTSAPAPALIVLLHGCKQDAADFARGTAMNALAASQNCVVLYPEQLAKANSMRCWNWFDPAHQSRESGEPGMLAALTRQVIAEHGVDASRVYVAGLSAGGAMSAVLASEYPDLFAAAGIHSGLARGAARGAMSAFSAMRRGPASRGTALKGTLREGARPVPVIVFHGQADQTVNPGNGEHIVETALQAFAASSLPLRKTRTGLPDTDVATQRSGQRSVFHAADGLAYVESWEIEDGPHAWSGGHAGGSYTDPDGPSASVAMLVFFLQHQLNLH